MSVKRRATKAISLTRKMKNIELEKKLDKKFAVVITERWGYNETVFDATVSADELSETIERELNAIGAKYPLTYANDLPVFIQDEAQIEYRIDTEDEDDSHLIVIADLSA